MAVIIVGPKKRNATGAIRSLICGMPIIELNARADLGELLRDAAKITDRTSVHGVIATSESSIAAAGFLRSNLNLPGPKYDECVPVTNKVVMRARIGTDIRQPKYWWIGEFLSLKGDCFRSQKFVLKPSSLSACRGVRVMSREEIENTGKKLEGLYFVEEYVDAQSEFHVDGIWTGSEIQWREISQYDCPTLLSQGTRMTCLLSPDNPMKPKITDMTRQILEKLSVNSCVFHAEFLLDKTGFSFGEIGLRPGGVAITDLIKATCKVDLWKAFVESQLGWSVSDQTSKQAQSTSGLIMARADGLDQVPLPKHVASELPEVFAIVSGKLEHGEQPADKCESEYYALFSGLSYSDALGLKAKIAQGAGNE